MKKIFAAATAATLVLSPVFVAQAAQVVPEEEAPAPAPEDEVQDGDKTAPVEDQAPSEPTSEGEPVEDSSSL